MTSTKPWLRFHTFGVVVLLCTIGIVWTTRLLFAQGQGTAPTPMEPAFQQLIKPFLDQNCAKCHNVDNMSAGVRVDHLDTSLDDKHIRLWEGIRHRVKAGTMPPKGLPQPSVAERERVVEWIDRAIEIARLRPAPKNGIVRRLTVSQYKNTLRELLQLEDDLTEALPPDAVSVDGFVNNKETLQLSPLLLEAYFEIAEDALNRSIVDPKQKPKVQNFKVNLGESINPKPLPEKLILGANSKLLENKDFTVSQLTPLKPFAFEPLVMRTKYRFIEGYAGNDTVRGWRDYDSIYHSVFACVRGTGSYPKGLAYGLVPQGLLLRPAIPNEEIFEADGTFGPKANFKISLRELPDQGRFRVTVLAAKYNDGLMLDAEASAQKPGVAGSVVADELKAVNSLTIPKAGVYQVDVHPAPRKEPSTITDSSRLKDGLIGAWSLDGSLEDGKLEGSARYVVSPFGKAVSLNGEYDLVTIPRAEAMKVAEGDFTVSAWIRPGKLGRGGLVSMGGIDGTQGWYLDMPDGRGTVRLETAGPDGQPNGGMSSPPGVIRPNLWQHVAAVVKRGKNEARLYVNGYPVAKGPIGLANLDNPKLDLQLGRVRMAQTFKGDLDEVRIYRRALDETEIQALLEPGREFVRPPPEKNQDVTLTLGERVFAGTLAQPAFVVVRLDAGPLPVRAEITGMAGLDRLVLTPINEAQPLASKFKTFEKRAPRLGVHLGLRRDCGSTFAPVGPPQRVAGTKLNRYVFEGAISNFPSPNVEKDNVNYLAGIREIAVRSEYTDGRDMPRMLIKSVEFEGPFYEQWPPPSHRNIFVDSDKKNDLPAYARQVIRGFAAKAYRRPITAAEESSLMAIYHKNGNFQQGIKDALQVVLTSPQFLFLVEKSSTPNPEPINPHELASKLSYFLWNGPPDRTTLRLASTGVLAKQLDAEVARMVESPRFARFVQEFTSQWLSLDKFNVLEPDRKKFPNLTRDARVQLRQEPVQFVQHLMRKNLPVKNLIQSDFLMVNEVVASYYDMPDKSESGFQFQAIPHGRKELGGILTQASILAGLSDGRESNPVKRGAWLARRIIAEPPADPPPNVPALKEGEKDLTLRQRLEAHRNQPGCFQCHQKIDPWGVAFEEFDAGGRLKKDAVDAHSKLPDQTEVSGANDLKRYLGEDRIDQVAFSVFKHLATYANGRSLTYNELNELKRDGLKLKASGYPMQDMIRYVVNSKIFLEK